MKPSTATQHLSIPQNRTRMLAIVFSCVILVFVICLNVGRPTEAFAAPMNEGDPFKNGDLTWDYNTQAYRIAGVSIRVGGIQAIGSSGTGGPFPYPSFLSVADAAGTGNYKGWGYTDFSYGNADVTGNSRSVYFTELPRVGHCCQTNNTTTVPLERDARLLLLEEKSGWEGGVYHGVFVMLVDNAHDYGFFDQGTMGTTYVYADWKAYGSLELWKKSANPSITDGNSNYSLAGAEYGIYYNAACTNLYYKNTTKSDGTWRDTNNVPIGTYYVKELKASKGYELDPTVYKAVVQANQITYVGLSGNGGWVLEPPKTVTVRYYADGDPTPIYVDSGLPLGWNYSTNEVGYARATAKSRKPNCTPGLKAWYTDESLTKKYAGSTLMSNLNLYARNIATLTYAVCPGSPLAQGLELHASMSKGPNPLNVATQILPPARTANWNSKITLKEPRMNIVYYEDGERWRTLRLIAGGWYLTSTGTGAQIGSLVISQDTTVYCDWTISTYDGIVMW